MILCPKTNEEYVSVTIGCIRFIDSYRFLSNSLDSLIRTLVDNSHRTLKSLEKVFVDDEILKIVNETKILTEEDRYSNDSIKDLQKYFPDKFAKLEETSDTYISENYL